MCSAIGSTDEKARKLGEQLSSNVSRGVQKRRVSCEGPRVKIKLILFGSRMRW